MAREEEIRQAAYKEVARLSDNYDRRGGSPDYEDIQFAFENGAEWADSHNPEIAALEHEIERLKSKLQVADDLSTLLISELEKAKSPWISVEEKLPEKYELVLIRIGRGNFYLAEKDNITQPRDAFAIPQLNCYVNGVTHWMPIPELSATK